MTEEKKSWLLKVLEWIHPHLSNTVVGWLYASNSIIAFIMFYFLQTWVTFMMGVLFFLIAVLFWSPDPGEKG